jgi:hypothetical protein
MTVHSNILTNLVKTQTAVNSILTGTDTINRATITDYTAVVPALVALENNQDYNAPEMRDVAAPLKRRSDTETMLETARKGYLLNMLNGITATAKSLTSCVTEVYKELSDIPMYFETYKNSITDYKNRTGVMALMPLSQVSHLLNPNIYLTQKDPNLAAAPLQFNHITALRPIRYAGVGSSSFKFTYGTRGLLASDDKPAIELAPGVLSILDTYNAKFGGAASYDKARVVSTFEKSVCLLRYVTDIIYHKSYLGENCLSVHSNDFVVIRAIVATEPPTNNTNIVHNMACQTGAHEYNTTPVVADLTASFDNFFLNSDNVTLLSDNDNYNHSVKRMLSCIASGNNDLLIHKYTRKNMRIRNILDCNIVPINFHAMQREIPMVNLFNYAYTFDHMVKNFIGVEFKNKAVGEITSFMLQKDPINPGAFINSDTEFLDTHFPEDTLVRMLIHPRGLRLLREYSSMTMRIMTGATSLSLNRPKYLSDQLWNKVLLNSSFSNRLPRHLDNRIDTNLNENRQNAFLQRVNNGGPINGINVPQDGAQNNLVYAQEPLITLGFTDTMFTDGNMTNIGPSVGDNNMLTRMIIDPATQRGTVTDSAITAPNASRLNFQGYLRYQTKMVRYLEWFVQVQRVMRLLMRSELEWINDPIVHGHNSINEHVTEYEKNNKYAIEDFE